MNMQTIAVIVRSMLVLSILYALFDLVQMKIHICMKRDCEYAMSFFFIKTSTTTTKSKNKE